MRRFLALALVFVFASHAEAVTVRDIVDLSRAGMGEDVLLALIEVDGGVFRIDAETLTMLKQEGVSERVILAMVRSGRTRPPEEPAPPVEVAEAPAPPPVVIIEHERAVPVPVAVPVYVPVATGHGRFGHRRRGDYLDRDYYDRDPATERRDIARPAEPVYWGNGGKLRPDAWQPALPRRDR